MVVLYCARPNTPDSDPYSLGELEKGLRDKIYTAMHYTPRYLRTGVSGLALVSGFRDPGRQWDLRVERVGRRDACNPARRANPATAVPYASEHQKRRAADLGGVDLPWLLLNRGTFGLAKTVPSENWHYEDSGVPCRVPIIEYPGPNYDGDSPAIPQPDPIADDEEFTMDAEAKAAFAALNKQIVDTRTWVKQELGKVTQAQNAWIKAQNDEQENHITATGDRVIRSLADDA